MTDTLTLPEVQPPSAPSPEPPRRDGVSTRYVVAIGLVLALGALLAIILTVGGGSSSKKTTSRPAAATPAATKTATPALGHSVGVSLSEFKVAPSVTAAAAGKVTFSVTNNGNITHEFVVIRTDRPAGSLLKGARADESGNVGETGDLKVGAAKTITLNLKPGHYALICNLPGHYKSGQHTDFTVR
jgi:uncharacterized cupredoxin-like copper-binding protein